jgi:hypothetical protein
LTEDDQSPRAHVMPDKQAFGMLGGNLQQDLRWPFRLLSPLMDMLVRLSPRHCGCKVSDTTIWRTLCRMGLSLKEDRLRH